MLDATRPTDLLAVADRLTFLQLDPTAIVAPSADLVAWSRLGAAYQPSHLERALNVDRTMFEHRDQDHPKVPVLVTARPSSSLALYLPHMVAMRRKPGTVTDWLKANAKFRSRVLAQLRDSGPLASRDIADTAAVPWKSSGWTGERNVTQMLEFLMSRGYVAVAGRDGKQRLFDVAERVYDPDVEKLSVAEATRRRDERRLRSLGVGLAKFLGDAGIPVEIEGSSRQWRLDPEATADDFEGRTALLSPFDRLFHDYERTRMVEVFGFEFMIEFYKPKDKRRWGYFVMPVLHGDGLVGKLDVSTDRYTSTLVVHRVHEDEKFTRTIRSAVDAELAALASWLGLASVAHERNP